MGKKRTHFGVIPDILLSVLDLMQWLIRDRDALNTYF